VDRRTPLWPTEGGESCQRAGFQDRKRPVDSHERHRIHHHRLNPMGRGGKPPLPNGRARPPALLAFGRDGPLRVERRCEGLCLPVAATRQPERDRENVYLAAAERPSSAARKSHAKRTAKLAGSSGTGVATSAKMAAANGVPNQKWQICQNGKTSLQFR
jgi:hypothetical protein